MVDSWESDPSKLVRDINLEVATISAKIDELVDTYELTSDVSNFALWRSLVALNYSCQRAASLFRQSQPQNITITVAVATPLRVIVTETYGAREAERRYAEVMRLNDIDDPLLVPAGSVLKAPAPSRTQKAT